MRKSIALFVLAGLAEAFVPPVRRAPASFPTLGAAAAWALQHPFGVMPLAASSRNIGDDDNEISTSSGEAKRRRRKRRAEAETTSQPHEAAAASPPPRRRKDDAPVALSVTDVRSLVGGEKVASAEEAVETSSSQKSSSRSAATSSTNLASSSMSKDSSSTTEMSSSTSSSSSTDDALERMLQDARAMQADDDTGLLDGTKKIGNGNEDSLSIPGIIRNVLSTIVTVDFFVVCAFLLWFLAGIAARAIWQDDTIQIAFNNNFETLVQPALGLLMIAAIAGNFFKEDEETAF